MSDREPTFVPCPTCGKNVTWGKQSPWRPFCSERCRLIDLGEWFDEKHKIPSEETSFDEDLSEH
ncbi:DNA gyrase inhibitor YacG [endosymbiont of Lamellibrachia barhami]|uniref:DNA gyrase inhibitor YacG n=1 Tax=endosymbiont of Lamellibrachia barhami TaxID=205975 RepID=UPI0015AC9EC8|nr:DNA gyrase inhibitor YacG [endosymbiont of Lamellibrachia barhami]